MRVVGASNQTEAEFIQGMLLEEGVPSTLRRTRGFDVPDMLAAGPRDIMVPASGHAAAREVLLQAELVGDEEPGTPPSQVLTFLLAAVAIVALIAWVRYGAAGLTRPASAGARRCNVHACDRQPPCEPRPRAASSPCASRSRPTRARPPYRPSPCRTAGRMPSSRCAPAPRSPSARATAPTSGASPCSTGVFTPAVAPLGPLGCTSDDGVYSMIEAPDGKLYFTVYDLPPADGKGAVGRVNPDGSGLETAVVNDGHPLDLAVGSDGNVWFTINGPAGKVGRITPASPLAFRRGAVPGQRRRARAGSSPRPTATSTSSAASRARSGASCPRRRRPSPRSPRARRTVVRRARAGRPHLVHALRGRHGRGARPRDERRLAADRRCRRPVGHRLRRRRQGVRHALQRGLGRAVHAGLADPHAARDAARHDGPASRRAARAARSTSPRGRQHRARDRTDQPPVVPPGSAAVTQTTRRSRCRSTRGACDQVRVEFGPTTGYGSQSAVLDVAGARGASALAVPLAACAGHDLTPRRRDERGDPRRRRRRVHDAAVPLPSCRPRDGHVARAAQAHEGPVARRARPPQGRHRRGPLQRRRLPVHAASA